MNYFSGNSKTRRKVHSGYQIPNQALQPTVLL